MKEKNTVVLSHRARLHAGAEGVAADAVDDSARVSRVTSAFHNLGLSRTSQFLSYPVQYLH